MKRELVFDRHLGKVRPVGPVPISSSADLGWEGISLEHCKPESLEAIDITWLNNVVVLPLDRPFTLEIAKGSQWVQTRILPGKPLIFPAGAIVSNRTSESYECLGLSLTPAFITSACCEIKGAEHAALEISYGVDDPFVAGICLALKSEVENGGLGGRVYAESLGTSLAVHLVSKYAGKNQSPLARLRSGIPLRSVRKAIDFINDRLNEDISLHAIAEAAGLSPFHFARQFKRSTGLSPHQFIIKLRVEQAKHLLLKGEHAPAEIAVQVGFCDQSHLVRNFKRVLGVTPSEFMLKTTGRARSIRRDAALTT